MAAARLVTAILAAPIVAGMMYVPVVRAHTVPKFDVVSIKPCTDAGGRGAPDDTSPGRLYLSCHNVRLLIRTVLSAQQALSGRSTLPEPIEGGPAWINSERYTIEAKAEGTPAQDLMRGPMLLALLEERFALKMHRETREVPMYGLTVAKGGLKVRQAEDRSCTAALSGGRSSWGCVKLQKPQGPCTSECGPRLWAGPFRVAIDISDASMALIAQTLRAGDRPVIDKTGVTEKFDFHLEHARDETAHSEGQDAAPSIFTALGQLGLRLEPTKGPRDFVIIDRVEKPSEN